MKQITLADVRQALDESINANAQETAPKLTDEQLLETDLMADFKMDSLELIELTMHLEHNLNIRISDDMFSECKEMTVRNLLQCCNSHIEWH